VPAAHAEIAQSSQADAYTLGAALFRAGLLGLLPRDRLASVPAVRSLLCDAGIPDGEVVAEESRHPLGSPEDWWTIVLGTGARWVIDRMTVRDAMQVKQANLAWPEENGIGAIETNVIYAVATKGQNGSLSWVI
jgi:hypothetical protein